MSQFLNRSGAGSDRIYNEMNTVLQYPEQRRQVRLLKMKRGEDTAPGHVDYITLRRGF